MQSTGYFATIYRFGVLICGPKNRVFDIKSGHDFCRYRNSIQVIYFQINGSEISLTEPSLIEPPDRVAQLVEHWG